MRNKPEPPTKWTLRNSLLDELYKPVIEQRNNEIHALIEGNCALLLQDDKTMQVSNPGHFHRSFAFNGKFYSVLGDAGPPVRNRVHPDLTGEVRAHVQFYEQIDQECLLIKGYLDSVFSFSSSPGDWIRLLPDTLQPTLHSNILATPDGAAWPELRTPEECTAFLEKRRGGFELIRQRLAMNLISI